MSFPFISLVAENRELGLIIAVLLGFGFGFVLERAGFGRANKLVAQFYLFDMTVFKVMFGAIVTAMIGMVVISGLGLADLRGIADTATSATFLVPMIVGGFLVGAGFIIAGYCPGTSIVSAASGNLDGLLTFGGVVLGTVLYSEGQPFLAKFHESNYLGQIYLYDLLKVPAPVVALLVAAMAIGCFIGAEKVERIFKARLGITGSSTDPMESPRVGRKVFAGFATAAAVGAALLAMPGGKSAEAGAAPLLISQEALARKVLEAPWSLRVLDLRALESCTKQRVPGAECVPSERLAELSLGDDQSRKDLVLVADGELPEIPKPARAYPGRVLVLEGGFEGWKAYALTPAAPPETTATHAELAAYHFRRTVYSGVTGAAQLPPPPPPPSAGGGAPRKKGGGGCSS